MRYLSGTLAELAHGKFVLLSGPRQVGKTTLAQAWAASQAPQAAAMQAMPALSSALPRPRRLPPWVTWVSWDLTPSVAGRITRP